MGKMIGMRNCLRSGCRVKMADERVIRRVREKRQRTGAVQNAAAGPGTPAREISVIDFREYQKPLMVEESPGLVVLHWARQIGKSFTLAAWAVDRLLRKPGRLVTVLSNSRDNGAEFVRKCAEICERMEREFEVLPDGQGEEGKVRQEGASNGTRGACAPRDIIAESFRMEVRITVEGQVGRIKVLAANPRTARGFSGDLILDEFAFHEDSAAIWEAAEPILASNPDFRCRIASTGNGKHNMFYRMANGVGFNDGTLFENPNGFIVSRVAGDADGGICDGGKDLRFETRPGGNHAGGGASSSDGQTRVRPELRVRVRGRKHDAANVRVDCGGAKRCGDD